MNERLQQLMALGPPYPGIEHPRCRVCPRFADYSMHFTGGRRFRSTRRHYCVAHLPLTYHPFKEEADQRYAEQQARLEESLRQQRAQGE